MEKAFGVTLPKREGIAANQPTPFCRRAVRIWAVAACAALLAFAVQVGSSGRMETVTYSTFHIEQDNAAKSFSTPVFAIPGRTNVVVRSAVAPLNNNWVDLDLSWSTMPPTMPMRPASRSNIIPAWTTGNHWSEGDAERETYFAAVAPGTTGWWLSRHRAAGAGWHGLSSLTVMRNVRALEQLLGRLVFIFSFPLYAGIYRRYFEYKRWENSDFAPAITNRDDSDD